MPKFITRSLIWNLVIGHNQHELWKYKKARHGISYLLILYEQMIGTTLPE